MKWSSTAQGKGTVLFGRHTTLLGRIMAAIALFTVLTGSSEEYGGMVVHVELAYAEHPVPEGVASWDDVIPGDATGPRYYWAPTGWVMVQRTDGSFVRARNEFAHARYMSRVSIMETRSGRWMITAVENRGEGDEMYEPKGLGPPSEESTLVASAPDSERRAAPVVAAQEVPGQSEVRR